MSKKVSKKKVTSKIADKVEQLAGANPGEKCPRCRSKKYAVDSATKIKRYCEECGHVWIAQSRDQILLAQMKDENAKLKNRIIDLEEELAKMVVEV